MPPGRDAHVFTYTAVDQEESYTPPALNSGPTVMRYDYNLDKELELITRPDGQTIDLEYDAGARLARQLTATGSTTYGYHTTTGQLT